MGPSTAGLIAQLAFFIAALVLFGLTFIFRKPGSKIFASFQTVHQTYTPPGAFLFWVAWVCLFIGIILQLANRL